MTQIILVVRQVGRLTPEYQLTLDVPEIPRRGDYISVNRPDAPEPYGEDFIVREIGWRFKDTNPGVIGADTDKPGKLTEITVEVDQAIGPYSSDRWRDMLVRHQDNGKEVPVFAISRLQVRQDFLTNPES